MPFTRPTLTALRNQIAQDIATALPGADALLRFSNLKIMGDAQAALASLHYGYLDWISKQAVPFTASDEFLEGWAGLKNVWRKATSSASGKVTYPGTVGAVIPLGAVLVRGDGKTATVKDGATFTSTTAIVSATVDADGTGETGAFGNCDAGTIWTLDKAISGVQSDGYVSTAFVGGSDLETDDSLRSRMLEVYQNQPEGGSQDDYVKWALEVPGVTRAWCVRNGFGIGTVVVYTMFDESESVHGGFPQGSNGSATNEPRATAATGDQLIVANYISDVQPVTALVYSVSPTAHAFGFTIKGIPLASQSLIPAAIADVFFNDGSPGGTVPIAHIWSAIAAVSGVNDFVIVSPADDITNATGALPTVGTLTFTS